MYKTIHVKKYSWTVHDIQLLYIFMILSTRKSVKYMLLKNDIITQKILIDNFIYAVTYQDGNFILHHDQLLSPAYLFPAFLEFSSY